MLSFELNRIKVLLTFVHYCYSFRGHAYSFASRVRANLDQTCVREVQVEDNQPPSAPEREEVQAFVLTFVLLAVLEIVDFF